MLDSQLERLLENWLVVVGRWLMAKLVMKVEGGLHWIRGVPGVNHLLRTILHPGFEHLPLPAVGFFVVSA